MALGSDDEEEEDGKAPTPVKAAKKPSPGPKARQAEQQEAADKSRHQLKKKRALDGAAAGGSGRPAEHKGRPQPAGGQAAAKPAHAR